MSERRFVVDVLFDAAIKLASEHKSFKDFLEYINSAEFTVIPKLTDREAHLVWRCAVRAYEGGYII